MLASVLLAALVTQAAPPAAQPAPNPAIDARAREWFGRLQADRIDYGALDSQAAGPLNSDVGLIISTDWSALGAPVTFAQTHVTAPSVASPDWLYVYQVSFQNGIVLNFSFGLDSSGKISGMRLAPH